MELRDYNGTGRWAREAVVERYREYCRGLRVQPRELRPLEHEEGGVLRIYPILEKVIEGAEQGDVGCIALGVELLEEDQRLPFGKLLKSNMARALRRAELDPYQRLRIRIRVVQMLLAGNVPREFKQYAKLLRRIGFGEVWDEIERGVPRENRYAMRWYRYLSECRKAAGKEAPGSYPGKTPPG